MKPDALPIVFGITGHRDIPAADVETLARAVRSIFAGFRTRYPATPLVLLTPLAVGADRLVARVALEEGMPIRVPMPFDEAEYRKDFTATECEEFDALVARSVAHHAVPIEGDAELGTVGEGGRRAQGYAAVGRYLARNAHVLVALWNGDTIGALGGTADVVRYRLYGARARFSDGASMLDEPSLGVVYHVLARRNSDGDAIADSAVGTIVVKTRTGDVAPNADPYAPLYRRIERFNRDRASLDGGGLTLAAERLATRFQRRYTFALDAIHLATPLAALSLALSSRTPIGWLTICYCALIGIAFSAYRISNAGRWKDRAIEYRALEIGLRVQSVWDAVGLDAGAADYYLRIQHTDLEWIRDAIRVSKLVGARASTDVADGLAAAGAFVRDQRAFFERSARRDRARDERWKFVTNAAIAVDITITFALLVLSLAHVNAVHTAWNVNLADLGDELIRALALVTILAAVSHEYSARRAFHAQSRRYAAVFAMYDRANDAVDSIAAAGVADRLGVTRELVFQVGKEALAENGEWLMLQRDLPVEMLHV